MEKKNYKYIIAGMVCFCGLGAMYCQYQMAPVADQIMETYNLSQMQYSTLFSAPMVPAVFLSLICGIIVDKAGARRVIFFSLLLAAFGLWGRASVNSYTLLYICMLCPGVATTFINSTNAKIFGEWFSEKQVSIAVGFYLAVSALGQALGNATTALFPSLRSAFIVSAALTSVTAVLWLLFMKDRPKDHEEHTGSQSVLESLKIVIKSRNVLVASLGIMCTYSCFMLISTYLPMILQDKGVDDVTAGTMASFMSVGALVGSLAVPILVGKVKKYRASVLVLAILGASLMVSIIFANNKVVLDIILFSIGLTIGGIIPLFMSLPVRLPEIGVERAGTAGGFLSTFQLLGGVIIPSYIITPLSGGSFSLMLVFGAIVCLVVCILACLLTKQTELE